MPPVGENYHDPIVAAQQNYGPASPIIPAMLDTIFLCFMRSPVFFDEARRFIRQNQFDEAREQHYRALWQSLCTLRDQRSAFTNLNVITEIHRMLVDDAMAIHPSLQPLLLTQDQRGIVWAAFNAPVEEVDVHTARGYLREFLQERTVASPLRRFVDSVNIGETPYNFNEFLDTIITQRDAIRTMDTLPCVIAAPDLHTVLEAPSIFHPTGIEWIDSRLGGIREGDAIGILGGTGSGKSTLGAHIAVETAKREYEIANQQNRNPRWVGFFTYEESVKKMRVRIWSSAFQIQRSRLERLTHPATELTTRETLLAYERNLFGNSVDEAVSEQERWVAGSRWLNQTLYLFDMSGSADFPHAGRGFIQEIVACIEANVIRTGTTPKEVVIDYAGLVCRNHMAAQNMDEGSLRHLLAEFGDRCRRDIAERFGCTVIILHQIAPAEGQRHSTALLHHSMASESRAFAENLAACGCIGNADPSTGCRRFNWSKIRYEAQEKVQPVTLRIDEHFARMENVDELYVVDDAGRRFVPKDAAERIHGGAQDQQTAQAGPAGLRNTSDPQQPATTYSAADAALNNNDVDPVNYMGPGGQ